MRFFPDQDDFNAQVNGLVTLDLVRKDGSNLVLTERGKVALRLELTVRSQSATNRDYAH